MIDRLQRQHERRIAELELGVVLLLPRRFDAEKLPVKLDRLLQVGDVDGDVRLAHRK